ncbi:MAG: hypothetical protein V4577_31515 [Bacteroidota bacterium]
MKLDEFVDQLSTSVKSFIIFYFTMFITIFLGIWTLAAPFDIKQTFHTLPDFLKERIFWHLLLTLIISAYFTLLIEIYFRKRYHSIVSTTLLRRSKSNKRIFIVGANTTGVKIIERISEAGLVIKGIYDKNSHAAGIKYGRDKSLAVYTNQFSELRSMLNQCIEEPNNEYYIFLTTENHNFVLAADEIIRGIRKHSKNFKYYRLGIDFEVNPSLPDILNLTSVF